MLIIEYYDDPNKGMINKNTRKNELRKLLKSDYIASEKKMILDLQVDQSDLFRSLGILSKYQDNDFIKVFIVSTPPIYLSYNGFNLFTNFNEIVEELGKRNIPYSFTSESGRMFIENENIEIQIPDLDFDENNEVTIDEEGKVIMIIFNLEKLNGSISFERLSSHHIPSKVTYENSNISSDDGPAIRMDYDHEKYFASHGKSRKTLRFLELQKQLVQEGKIMKAIQVDEEDIRFKTSSTYASALKEMKDYARKLDPNDFISKK